MKTCCRCGETKPFTEFNRSTARGFQVYCRECNKKYLRQHYEDNKEYYANKSARFRTKIKTEHQTKLLRYFAEHPCVDCGESDPVVLQFDHVRGVKFAEVLGLNR